MKKMAQQISSYIVAMMADRAWRMQEYLWHEVRNSWLFYDDATRQALRSLGWEPPRPASRPRPDGRAETILDNNSREDFLYMRHEMIRAVNQRLAGDPQYPRVEGWREAPRRGDADYPVPPPWDADAPLRGPPLNRSVKYHERQTATAFQNKAILGRVPCARTIVVDGKGRENHEYVSEAGDRHLSCGVGLDNIGK